MAGGEGDGIGEPIIMAPYPWIPPPPLPPAAMTARNPSPSAPNRLRALLAGTGCLIVPCCFDALSARLIEQAGFPLTFMSGFAVAAARLALPDTGLITVTEMLDQGRAICQAVSIPVIGDGDTGHGNPVNVRRTVEQFGLAGFAAVMIEDQVAPKRCGHTEPDHQPDAGRPPTPKRPVCAPGCATSPPFGGPESNR